MSRSSTFGIPIALLILAASGAPSFAADTNPASLAVEGPTAVPRDKLVRLSVKDPDPKAAHLWIALQPERIDQASTGPNLFQFAAPPGKYTVVLVKITVKENVPTATSVTHTVTVGGDSGGTDPPKPPDPKDPPTDPTGKLYFMVVRKDGPADPAFTRVMSDPAWGQLRERGHLVKDFEHSAARAYLGVGIAHLPAVVTLEMLPNNMARVARPAVPLPTTSADILKLAEGF